MAVDLTFSPSSLLRIACAVLFPFAYMIQRIIALLSWSSPASLHSNGKKTAVLAIGTSHLGCEPIPIEESLPLVEKVLRGRKSDSFVNFFKRTLKSSGTKTRYNAIQSGFSERGIKSKTGIFPEAKEYYEPTPEERNRLWMKHAPIMAVDAAKKALENWNGDKQRISHIIFHSCTGFKAPGIELDVIDGLGLKNVKRRVGINFMGCFGGLNGLAIAKAFCDSDPSAVCLLVCVEICSAHMTLKEDRSYMIGNSIFTDGASAAIIGQGRAGDWMIVDNEMMILGPETRSAMTWMPSDGGYEMFLDPTLGQCFGLSLFSKINSMIHGLTGCWSTGQVHFCIHPGGKGILLELEKIGISRDQLRHSWEILTHHGNMSSATILFVLKAAIKDPTMTKDSIFAMAFGPGLTIEACGLRKIPYDKI